MLRYTPHHYNVLSKSKTAKISALKSSTLSTTPTQSLFSLSMRILSVVTEAVAAVGEGEIEYRI